MRHNRKRFLILILSTFSIPLYAAVPSQVITWNHADISPTRAQLMTYKLYINEESGRKTVLILNSVLCGTVNGMTQCSIALPQPAGNPAIISNNQSQISATEDGIETPLSLPFIGNQGCIFRDNLYSITARASASANKNQLNALRNEFKNAKFKEISITQKGNQFTLLEECVGFIVQN